MIRAFVTTALALCLTVPSARADDATLEVKSLAREKVNAVINLLRDRGLEKRVRNQKILATIDPIFDFALMAKLSLGKKYWVEMDDERKEEFVDVFVKKLKASYLEKLDLYTDEAVEVADAVQVKSRVHVKTNLISKGDKKEMIYKFYRTGEEWKVYDVEVLGVSIVQTYRNQFDGFLQDGTMTGLIEKLKGADPLEAPAPMDKKT